MLFGHQNDDNKPVDKDADGVTQVNTSAASAPPIADDSSADLNLPAMPDDLVSDDSTQTAPAESQLQAPVTFPPTNPIQSSNELVAHIPEPTPTPNPAAVVAPTTEPLDQTTVTNPSTNLPPVSDDLLALKQQALQQLEPLVGHLEQSPEEKFRTTMMMIQSTDNQALLTSAYETAQTITDDKVRAQALLDVVNEINYFTQHPQSAK